MIDKVLKEDCCLCKACVNICPTEAIRMDIADHGFLYPRIDGSRCIQCNKCEQACPSLQSGSCREPQDIKAYAARSRDDQNRISSTSGGLFFEFARRIIAENGYVCGAVQNETFQVYHSVADDLNEAERMKGSKYVQSDVKSVYQQIEQLLKDQKTVLFCGCPCQVAGLNRYLGREYDRLYRIELICHGVSSQSLFDSYRASLETQKKAKITHFEFRHKRYGWHNSAVLVGFDSGKKLCEPITVNAYMKALLSGSTLKEACYKCAYNGFRSGADITLGDLWGAEVLLPDMDDNKGLSAVLLQTEKGKKLFDALDVDRKELPLEHVSKYNRNILEPTAKNPLHDVFFSLAERDGYQTAWRQVFQEKRWETYRRKGRYALRCLIHWIRRREKPLY